MTPPAIAKTARAVLAEVEDVQGRADTRRLPINRVGIKDISHPVRVKDRSAGEQHTIATFNMYVSLPHNFKGTHMSRFVEILHTEREISVESFRAMLATMTERLEADVGHIEMSFPFFVMKRAPVSGVESLMDYHASLIGERRNGETQMWVKVVVPVTSLCPCSKRIADYGAHNQRSHVTISARLALAASARCARPRCARGSTRSSRRRRCSGRRAGRRSGGARRRGPCPRRTSGSRTRAR